MIFAIDGFHEPRLQGHHVSQYGGGPAASLNLPAVILENKRTLETTDRPSSLQEGGRDSSLRAVLCYERIFTKACMGCKRFFLKERKKSCFYIKSTCLIALLYSLLFARVSGRFEAFR